MGKWYKQGLQDALDGINDPPWQEGHRDHTSYCEGHADGEGQLERDATPFKVEGVETEDGSRTLLAEFDNSGEARAFLNRYTARENAGNWDLIEVYDTRGEDSERLFFWERGE